MGAELERERLQQRLDAPYTVVVLEGVIGSGRSTLLRQWHRRQGTDCRVLVRLEPQPDPLYCGVSEMLAALAAQGFEVRAADLTELAAAAEATDSAERVSGTTRVVVRVLKRSRQPVTMAIQGVDAFDASEVRLALTQLLRQVPSFRLLVATDDGAAFAAALRARRISTSRISEDVLFFTEGEVADYLAHHLPQVGQAAARTLHAVTGGHPGSVTGAVRDAPRAVAAGTLTPAQIVAFGPWSNPQVVEGWSEFGRFLAKVAPAHRFCLEQAVDLQRPGAEEFKIDPADLDRRYAEAHVARLDHLGLGRWQTLPHRSGPHFVWEEPARQGILQAIRVRDGEGALVEVTREAARVAGAHQDRELELAAFLAAECYDEADAVAGDWLWELIETVDPVIGIALSSLPRSVLDSRAHLAVLRAVAGRRTHAAIAQARGRADRLLSEADTDRARMRALTLVALAANEADDLDAVEAAASVWLQTAEADWSHLGERPCPGRIADALLLAQCFVQLDRYVNVSRAVEIAEIILDSGGRDLDPSGYRRDTIARVRSMVTRLAGDTVQRDDLDPFEATPTDSSSQFELVLGGVTQGLRALDEAFPPAALDVTVQALDRITCPQRWPILLLTRELALVASGAIDGVAALAAQVLDSEAWRARAFGASNGPPRAQHALVSLIAERATGVGVPGPSWSSEPPREAPTWGEVASSGDGADIASTEASLSLLSALAGALGRDPWPTPFYRPDDLLGALPRVAGSVMLLETLRAFRLGDHDAAHRALADAIEHPVAAQVAPIALVLATPEEVAGITRIAESIPGGAGALAHARQYPGLPSNRNNVSISQRELDLLEQLRLARSNSEIAKELVVSVNTVKFHRANLYRKLGASTREEALESAIRHGL